MLHCIYDDPRNPWVAGGGAVRVLELYRRLVDCVDATVATGNYPGAEDGVVDGVQYLRLGSRTPYAWSRLTYAAAASRLLARGGYDVAVFDFSVYTPLRIPLRAPVGITVHHVTGPSAGERWGALLGGAVGTLERRMLLRARWFTATSAATFATLSELVPAGAKVRLVQAGVPDDLFQLERREADYLLYFGRLDWFQKGLDTLLEAFAILVRERPGLELRVAGRGKDVARVREGADRLGIAANVKLLGSASEDEKQVLFAGARVLLMPSRFEGFGMVAAEAMAAGVPIVAAAAGSLPEVVDEPNGGFLVPAEDPAALAARVAALLDDPGERTRVSHSARMSAERFRWDRIAREHLAFLHEIRRDTSGAA
ncbi:MAG: glycosyltransferase [Gemmatimonadetes bacterium]|nr:glycosyltransferase [Gemmatimonadota bacterium]